MSLTRYPAAHNAPCPVCDRPAVERLDGQQWGCRCCQSIWDDWSIIRRGPPPRPEPSTDALRGPECERCGRREVWHPDGSCHVFHAKPPAPALHACATCGATRSEDGTAETCVGCLQARVRQLSDALDPATRFTLMARRVQDELLARARAKHAALQPPR